jgi:hypothetical protein
MGNYKGLLLKYKLNRPLSAGEISDHEFLQQSVPSPSPPWYMLSVIKMNSIFLECVDKYYAWRGAFVPYLLFGILTFGGFLIWFLSLTIQRWSESSASEQQSDVLAFVALCLIWSPIIGGCIWVLRKAELFGYTHYPVRFNRKTRKVHVFRPNGTVMSEDWDKLYFTLGKYRWHELEIVGHRLAGDRKTVLETFGLPWHATATSPTLYAQWEFVRRYMEHGPEQIINQVEVVMPIDQHRESFFHGAKRLFMNDWNNPIVAILFLPLTAVCALGRWISMITSKIPHWPEEIEAECATEQNDPNLRDEFHLTSPETAAKSPWGVTTI